MGKQRRGKERRGASRDSHSSDSSDGEDKGGNLKNVADPLQMGVFAFLERFFEDQCSKGGLDATWPLDTQKWIAPIYDHWTEENPKPDSLIPEEAVQGAAGAQARAANARRSSYAKKVALGEHVDINTIWRLGGGGQGIGIPTPQELADEPLLTWAEVLSTVETNFPSATQKANNAEVSKALGSSNTETGKLLGKLVDYVTGPLKPILQALMDTSSRRNDPQAERRYKTGVHLYVINYWLALALIKCPQTYAAWDERAKQWATASRKNHESALEWCNRLAKLAQHRGTEPPLSRNSKEFKKKLILGCSLSYHGSSVLTALKRTYSGSPDPFDDPAISVDQLIEWLDLEIGVRRKDGGNGQQSNDKAGKRTAAEAESGDKTDRPTHGRPAKHSRKETPAEGNKPRAFSHEERQKLILEARKEGVDPTCFRCGNKGHKQIDCPKGQESAKSAAKNGGGGGNPNKPKDSPAKVHQDGKKPTQGNGLGARIAAIEAGVQSLSKLVAEKVGGATPSAPKSDAPKHVMSVAQRDLLQHLLDNSQTE